MDKAFKKNFLKGSASASIGQISSMLFHFLSISVLARSMEVKEFGLYSLILAITYLFNTLGSFGLEITLVKFITSEEKQQKDQVLFPVLLLKLITTALFCLIFYFLSDLILQLFDKNLSVFAFYITILIFLGSFRDVFYNLLQGLNLFKKYAIVQTISAAIRVILILLFVFLSILTFNNLIIIEILTTVLAIFALVIVLPLRSLLAFTKDTQIYKSIIRFTLPVYFNNIFTIIYGRSNLFIIGIFLTPASVAYYDVASKIPEALKKMFNSFILVYFPNLSKLLAKGDKSSAVSLMNKSIGIFNISLGIIVFISYVFSKEITILLFSEKYITVTVAFSLLMFNFLLRTSGNIMGYSILSAGRPEIPMKVNIVTSIISLGGTLIFVPIVGYIGAVYALLIMNITSLFQYYYYLKKLDLEMELTNFLKPIIILLVSGFIFYLLPEYDNELLLKIIFVMVFLAVNWFFIEDIRSLMNNIKKMIPIFNKSL